MSDGAVRAISRCTSRPGITPRTTKDNTKNPTPATKVAAYPILSASMLRVWAGSSTDESATSGAVAGVGVATEYSAVRGPETSPAQNARKPARIGMAVTDRNAQNFLAASTEESHGRDVRQSCA